MDIYIHLLLKDSQNSGYPVYVCITTNYYMVNRLKGLSIISEFNRSETLGISEKDPSLSFTRSKSRYQSACLLSERLWQEISHRSIRIAGRIHLHVIVSLKTCFLQSFAQRSLSFSVKYLYSLTKGLSIFKVRSYGALNPCDFCLSLSQLTWEKICHLLTLGLLGIMQAHLF